MLKAIAIFSAVLLVSAETSLRGDASVGIELTPPMKLAEDTAAMPEGSLVEGLAAASGH